MVRTAGWTVGVLTALAVASACGSSGGADPSPMAGDPDAGPTATDPDPDAAPEPNCARMSASYPDLGAVDAQVAVRPADEDFPDGEVVVTVSIELPEPDGASAAPDVLFVELWGDAAPFDDSGLAPGVYGIGGKQADLFFCGACVFVAADRMDGQPLNHHMASAGTLTLDAIDPTPGTGRVTGSIEGLTVREVTVDTEGQHEVVGGCEATIAGASFDVGVPAPE